MVGKYFGLKNIPERTEKVRQSGLTMVMDKGLSLREAEDFVDSVHQYVDIVKLGFGTSALTTKLKEKIALYRQANIRCYLGGTLFEAFVARQQMHDYERLVESLQLDLVEISDGCLEIDHAQKCSYIQYFAKNFTVLSEVGSKDKDKILPPYKWIELMNAELSVGAWKVIAEAREGGNIGIYRSTGEVRMGLIDEILTKVAAENIIWESPIKAQQDWFIKLLGANVNLGNIAPSEVIALETLRLGLRGDTFFQYLDK
ncbi:MAG: phosphosulfolactate synthase [Chitinophagales bacterium]|nr:phosphosulfolactate synthase [Bacteroidota bacterium]MCB9042169.1 phosphosulfolactate synthase [Chitinophagales bacterium]